MDLLLVSPLYCTFSLSRPDINALGLRVLLDIVSGSSIAPGPSSLGKAPSGLLCPLQGLSLLVLIMQSLENFSLQARVLSLGPRILSGLVLVHR